MRRRHFIATSVAGLTLGMWKGSAWAQEKPGKQLLELRRYRFASQEKLQEFDSFLARAAIPALNRGGIKPVGVFQMRKEDNPKVDSDKPQLYVLMPHGSPESFVNLVDRLATDDTFVSAADSVIYAPKSAPAYLRYESSLLLAFDSVPQLEVPTKADSRLFQLRIYESHSIERHLRKVHMFDEGGELAIFRRCGLNPVLFGRALVGERLPNLTYMVGFADRQAMDRAWDSFRKDPEWKALRSDETYKDTVSNITNLVLRPAASSQI